MISLSAPKITGCPACRAGITRPGPRHGDAEVPILPPPKDKPGTVRGAALGSAPRTLDGHGQSRPGLSPGRRPEAIRERLGPDSPQTFPTKETFGFVNWLPSDSIAPFNRRFRNSFLPMHGIVEAHEHSFGRISH